MNPVTIINTALCIIIVLLGSWGYQRNKNKAPLLIGIAFGLFGVSHIVKLIGLESSLQDPMIVIRVIAYLGVAFALWIFASEH